MEDVNSRADGVDRDAIAAAYHRTSPYIRRTPTIAVDAADLGLVGAEAPVTLKLECLQHAGSFKARGAFTSMLLRDVGANGVAAAATWKPKKAEAANVYLISVLNNSFLRLPNIPHLPLTVLLRFKLSYLGKCL